MRNYFKLVSIAAMVGTIAAAPAMAEGEWSGNVTLTSDYVFRGFSQTDGAPTVQGGFDYEEDQFYAGVWASGVDFSDGTSTEIDLYGGVSPTVGAFDLDFGAIYYLYPDAPDEPNQNFFEFYAGAATTLGETVEVGGSVAFSPDYYLETGQSLYTNITAAVPLGDIATLDAGVGYLYFTDDDDCMDCDYTDFTVGVSTSQKGFDFDLRYIGSDGDGVEGFDGDGGPAGDRVVVSVGRAM